DRALAKAVSEAYRRAGAGERGFEAVLFVDVPAHMVDVNVHPAKTEIRFADARTVWVAVEGAVRAALAGGVRRAPRADTARVETAVQTFLAREEIESPASEQRPVSAWTALPPSVVAEPSLDSRRDDLRDGAADFAASIRAADFAGANAMVLGQHRDT